MVALLFYVVNIFNAETVMRSSEKVYLLSDMLCDFDDVKSRISRISTLSDVVVGDKCRVNARFEIDEEHSCVSRTTKIHQNVKPIYAFSSEQATDVAQILDLAYKMGIVHGDLHPKNIWGNDSQIFIQDWEPCLSLQVQGRPTTMVTHPYVHSDDAKQKTVSVLTDLACFVRLAHKANWSRCEEVASMVARRPRPFSSISAMRWV